MSRPIGTQTQERLVNKTKALTLVYYEMIVLFWETVVTN